MLGTIVNVAAKTVIVTIGAMFLSALWLNFVDAGAMRTGSATWDQGTAPGSAVTRDRRSVPLDGLAPPAND